MKLAKFSALAMIIGAILFCANDSFAAISCPDGACEIDNNAQLYKKATTITGRLYDGEEDYGTATMKIAKIARNKTVKVTLTITPYFGSKISMTGTFIPNTRGMINGTFSFKKASALKNGAILPKGYSFEFFIDKNKDYFYGESTDSNYYFQSCTVGGEIEKGNYAIGFAMINEAQLPDGYDIITGTGFNSYPTNEIEGTCDGTKFNFGKAPTLKYVKNEYGNYEISGYKDANKPNTNAIILKYTKKTGAIKGSFKFYYSNEYSVKEGTKPKLKSIKATIRGRFFDKIPSAGAQYKYKRKAVNFRAYFDYPGEE